MSPVTTHAEHVAAELEARAALRDIWNHGYIGQSGPHRYAAAAGNLADSLADNPGTRTVAAIAANRAHRDGGRAPKPSVKAGRAALRALGRLTHDDRLNSPTTAGMVHTAVSEAIADAFHHATDAHGMRPGDVIALHHARTHGRFPSCVADDVRALVFLVGDLLALATAYGWAWEYPVWEAEDLYAEERDQ
ncbi:hypothetical protein ABT033_31345 [Streptomyces pharetrae]|uniref:hypothetical protein n=1 Tax=Streptomyces pharetrae TaxID=291370 RepID=UPI003354AC47